MMHPQSCFEKREENKKKDLLHVHWCDDVELFVIERIQSVRILRKLFYQRKDFDRFEKDAIEEEVLCFSDDEEDDDKVQEEAATNSMFNRWANGEDSLSSLCSELDTSSGSLTQPNLPSRRPSPSDLSNLIADNYSNVSENNNKKSTTTVRKATARTPEPNISVTPTGISSINERIENNFSSSDSRTKTPLTQQGVKNSSGTPFAAKTTPCKDYGNKDANIDTDANATSSPLEKKWGWSSSSTLLEDSDDENDDNDNNHGDSFLNDSLENNLDNLLDDLKHVITSKLPGKDNKMDRQPAHQQHPPPPLTPPTTPDTSVSLVAPPALHSTTSLGELEKIKSERKKNKEQQHAWCSNVTIAPTCPKRRSSASIDNLHECCAKSTSSRRASVEGPELKFLISRSNSLSRLCVETDEEE